MGTIHNGNSISTSLSDATNVVKKSNFLYIFQMKDIDRESMIYNVILIMYTYQNGHRIF